MAEEVLLTAVMIVRDEEHVLTRCLSSIKDLVDEIVVVDTGSQDKTKDIASGFGAKIFDLEWVNDFSIARNYGLEKATGDWILQIDADEELVVDDIDELKLLLRKKNVDVVKVSIVDSANGPVWQYARIFRNYPNFRYVNEIHEEITFETKEDLHVANSGIRIIHYGYEADVVHLKDKNKRNLEILESLINAGQESAKSLYYYGVEVMNTGDRELSNQYFKDAIDKNDDFYSALAFKSLAENYSLLGKLEEAVDTLNAGIRIFPDFTDLRFLAGINYLKLERPRKALEYFEDCLRKGPPEESFPQIPEVGGVLPLLFYGFCLHSLHEQKKAEKVFADAISALRKNTDALAYLAKLLVRLNGQDKAKEMIFQLADIKDPKVKKALGVFFPQT